jgi:hypothetical protein
MILLECFVCDLRSLEAASSRTLVGFPKGARSLPSGFVGDTIAQNAKAIDFHLDDIARLQPERRGSP